jgi:hypothetical protein
METFPNSLKLMHHNCKPVHACAYTVPRSVENQLHKKILRLVDIGVLEEDYSSEYSYFLIFSIPKKNGKQDNKSCYQFQETQLILETSSISYSKDWEHNPFNGRVFLCHSIGLYIKLELCTIQGNAFCKKQKSISSMRR